MTAPTSDIALVRQGYAAFARGDMTGLAEVLHPDVEWFVGGDNALTGSYAGRDATFGYFGRLLAATNGTALCEPLELTAPFPGTVLAMVHLHAEGSGRVFDEEGVQQFEVKDGKIVSCRTFLQNGHLYDDLIGPVVILLDQARTEITGRAAVR